MSVVKLHRCEDLGEVTAIDHDAFEGLEQWAGKCMKVHHNLTGPPPSQLLDLVIFYTPEEEGHCAIGTRVKGADVLVLKSLIVSDVTGD